MAAKLILLLALSSPQVLDAAETTGAEFAGWLENAQSAFLQNSVIMAAYVSSRTSQQHAECITDWFFDDSGIRHERRAETMDQISQYGDYPPTAILVALMEKACGPFGEAG